jgi:hypothetical protein
MRIRFILEALCVQILLAISVGQVSAACLNPPASPLTITLFKTDPQAIVAPNADTRTIEATVLELAGTDASLAADLVRVAEKALPRFKTAIAAGLAQAAIACANVDQQAALLIQQSVASFRDGAFQASFAAVAGDLSTAATAAATGFATGSVGSVIITNPNPKSGTTTQPGGGGIAATILIAATTPATTTSNTNNNGTSTTAANPVSPTR